MISLVGLFTYIIVPQIVLTFMYAGGEVTALNLNSTTLIYDRGASGGAPNIAIDLISVEIIVNMSGFRCMHVDAHSTDHHNAN